MQTQQHLTESGGEQIGDPCMAESVAPSSLGFSKAMQMKTSTLIRPQTTDDLYDWELTTFGLLEMPNLTFCFSMLDAFERLQRDYPDHFVEFGPNEIRMSREPGSESLIVLRAKGGVL